MICRALTDLPAVAASQHAHSAAARPQGTAGAATAGDEPDQSPVLPPLSPAEQQLLRLRLPSPFERHGLDADEGPLISRAPSPSQDSAGSSEAGDGPPHQPITLADRIPSLADWAGGAYPVMPSIRSADRLPSLAADRAPSLTPWIAAAAPSSDVHAAMDAAAAAALADGSRPWPASMGVPVSAALPVVPIRPLHLSRPSSLAAISEQQAQNPPAPELLSRSSPLHPLNSPSVPLGPFRLGPALQPHFPGASSPAFATAAFPSLQFDGDHGGAAAGLDLQAGAQTGASEVEQSSEPAHEEHSLRSQLFGAVGVAMDALWFGRSRKDSKRSDKQPQSQSPSQEEQQQQRQNG